MTRRIAALALAALTLVGCGGTPATPEISDPKEILAKALTAMAEVKTLHLEGEVTGTLNLDLFGLGEASEVRLTGTSGAADVDVVGSKMRASFTLIGLVDGELIQVGETSYVRTSQTGATFRESTGLAIGANPLDALAALQGLLDRPELAPVKLADASCGEANRACYQVQAELTAADIPGLASLPADLLGGVDIGSIRIVIGVEKDTLRIGRLVLAASAGATGTLELAINLSKWDLPISIEAPPADQVE
jgi:hypothetical protein